MRLAAPYMLLLLAVLPAFWLLHRRAERVRARRRAALIDAPLAGLVLPPDRPAERRVQLALGTAALAAIILALAQPQWGADPRGGLVRGRDIVVVLDVSASMLARDVEPDRLGRAKAAVRSLVDALSGEAGHRLALVTFAGRPEVRCPPTRDRALFLDRLESAGVGDLPQRGSAIGAALAGALDMLALPDPAFADFLLISDGEDQGIQAIEPVAAARLLAAAGARLHTVLIGDPQRASPIPIAGEPDRPVLLEYRGRTVESRPRPGLMTALAEAGGGRHVALGADGVGLARLHAEAIADAPQRELGTPVGGERAPRFELALAAALGLLALAALRRRAEGARP